MVVLTKLIAILVGHYEKTRAYLDKLPKVFRVYIELQTRWKANSNNHLLLFGLGLCYDCYFIISVHKGLSGILSRLTENNSILKNNSARNAFDSSQFFYFIVMLLNLTTRWERMNNRGIRIAERRENQL